jgi:hypothetical protein
MIVKWLKLTTASVDKKAKEPALMANTCNPSTWEAKIRRIEAQGQSRQTVLKTSSPK